MAKKAVEREPHLRIRVDPKLIARLEKARGVNGNTLTGEIVSRLEASFGTEDKVALLVENQKRLVESWDQSNAGVHRQWEAMARERHEERKHFEAELKRVEAGAAVVDALIGDNAASAQAVRLIALLLTNNPDWSASPGRIHKMIEDINAAVEAAAEESKQ
jgi:hypothetical protein